MCVVLASVDDIKNSRDNSRWLQRVDAGSFSKNLERGGPFFLHMNYEFEDIPETEFPVKVQLPPDPIKRLPVLPVAP